MDGTAIVALASLIVTAVVVPLASLAWREREKRFKAELDHYKDAVPEATRELKLAADQLRHEARLPPYGSLTRRPRPNAPRSRRP